MPRKKGRKNTPPAIWASLRGIYESGHCTDLSETHKEGVKIFGKKCPGVRTVMERAALEGWNKNKGKKDIEDTVRKNYEELLAAAGMGREQRVLEYVNGIKLADETLKRITQQIIDKKLTPLDPAFEDFLKEAFKNYNIKLECLDQLNKLTGDYAAVKITKTPADEDIMERPLDEILAEHDRIHATFELIKKTRKTGAVQ